MATEPVFEEDTIVGIVDATPLDFTGVDKAPGKPGSMVRVTTPYSEVLSRQPVPPSYSDHLVANDVASPPRGTGSPATDGYAGAVFGIIDADKTGNSIYDSVIEATDTVANSHDAHAHVAGKLNAEAEAQATETAWAASGVKQEQEDALKTTMQYLAAWRAATSNPFMGFEESFIPLIAQNVASIAEVGGEINKEFAYTQMAHAKAAQVWDATGGFDTFLDFAETAIIPTTVAKMAQYFDKWDVNLVRDIKNIAVDSASRVKNLSYEGEGLKSYMATWRDFWTHDTETRAGMFAVIEAHIRSITGGASGNKIVYTAMIEPFISKESLLGLEVDYFADTATIAAWPISRITKTFGAAVRIFNSRKTAQILINAGRHDKAAELLTEAIKERDMKRLAAATNGMTKVDVAVSLNPMDMQRLYPGQIKGVAAQAAARMDDEIISAQTEVDTAFSQALDMNNTLKRDYFNQVLKRKRMNEVLGKLNNDSEIASAHILESADDHFTVGIIRDPSFNSYVSRETVPAQKAVLDQKLKDLQAQKLNLAERASGYRKAGFKEDFVKQAIDEESTQLANATRRLELEQKIVANRLDAAGDDFPGAYEVQQYNYSFDEMGEFDGVERIGYLESYFKSPIHTIDRLGPQTADATQAGFKEAQIVSRLRTTMQDLRKNSTLLGRRRVDRMLLTGDELGKEFSIRELLDGVDTSWGRIKLKSADEVALYHAYRRLARKLHDVKNGERIKELTFRNYKEVLVDAFYGNGEQIKLFTKESDLSDKIDASVKRIFDASVNKVVNVTDLENLEMRLKTNWRVARLRTGQEFGDEIVEYAIIEPTKMRTPRGRVLHYLDGYVPRIREGVNYVVKQTGPRMVNGNQVKKESVIGMFSSKADADNFKAGHADGANLQVLPDKRLSKEYEGALSDEEFEFLNFGGRFDGRRSRENIVWGLDGAVAERRSAAASFDAYINHIANRWSTFDIKNSVVGKFQNTYGKYLDKGGTDWRAPVLPKYAQDDALYQTIEAERRFIKNMLRMPDPHTQWITARVRALSEWMEQASIFDVHYLAGRPQRAIMSLAGKDPLAALKTATFHFALGFWSVGSLVTQMLGMSIAATMYPVKAVKLLPQAMAVRVALVARNHPKALEMAAKAGGLPGSWLKGVVEELKKTNLIESLFTTGDYNAFAGGAGYTKQQLDKFLDAGQVFTKEGESWTRIYGYLLARDIMTEKKPIGYMLSNKEIAEAVNQSFKYTLNLNRAARASYQIGWLGPATQFRQIMFKFGENLAQSAGVIKGTNQWSKFESFKAVLGHLILFGAVGVPWGASMLASVSNSATKKKNEGTGTQAPHNILDFTGLPDAMQDRFISGGVLDTMTFMAFGVDIDLSKRASVPYGAQELVDLYKTGDASLVEALGGAALGMTISRLYLAAKEIGRDDVRVLDRISELGGINEITGVQLNPSELSSDHMWRVARSMASVASSVRAFDKAVWFDSLGFIADASKTSDYGRPLFGSTVTDHEQQALIVAQMLGLSSKKARQIYELRAYNERNNVPLGARADMVIQYIYKYRPEHTKVLDEATIRDYQFVMLSVTKDLDEAQQVEVRSLVAKKLAERDSPIAPEILGTYWRNKYNPEKQTKETIGNLMLSDIPTEDFNAQ